ncbi:hypothetical protein [Moorena sp. SIO4G3]|uniref:hypothetical protein n=1 Tax=Moorena sp. SIO4G3 TaxID=2607821 RepID=UPI001429FC67|nr:hypothetical protein [Moorena sp. SIO4G3]NEO79036.1 hypothetical protein [Moorena sp. SIO4G3]
MEWASGVERASCLFQLSGGHQPWNGHLACFNCRAGISRGTGILPVSIFGRASGVERASCLFPLSGGHQGWNGHLACFNFRGGIRGGTGILPVSIVGGASGVERASCLFQLSGGQDAHSTPIRPLAKINMKSKSIPFAFCLLPLALACSAISKTITPPGPIPSPINMGERTGTG